jgi:uncharacterized protein
MSPDSTMSSRRVWRLTALVACAVGWGWISPAAGKEVPFLSGRVNDLADLLSSQAENDIEMRLEALETESGAQIAVLTIHSLEGEVLEDYSLQVAETWKLGRGQFDDGALLLIVRDERKMRLEVGYGLEPILPDAIAKRILDTVLQPRFREGDFDGGVIASIDTIAGLVKGDGTLPPPAIDPAAGSRRHGPSNAIGFLVFLAIVGLFSLQALSSRGCAGWGLYLFLLPFWIFFPIAIFGRPGGYIPGVLWIVGFPLLWLVLHRTSGGKKWFDRHDGGGGGGWSSSGGGFGGGFSGGGGSFGGGGASGSW